MATRRRLVTPEAVELRFETAGLGSRLLATGIDVAVQVGILFLGILALGGISAAGGGGTTFATVAVLLLITGVLLGYPIAFETLWRGRTPGKAALGLRVVTRDGAPVRFRHAAVRGFLALVDLWATTGAAAVVSVLLTRDDQRLGDLAAGTLVLRERSAAGRPTSFRFSVPYGWESYAATLDVRGVTEADYGAVRSFLLRAASLPPAVRGTLAASVATPIAARLRTTPPPEVHPEVFLACVAALHQARSASTADAARAPVAVDYASAAAVWSPTTVSGGGGSMDDRPPPQTADGGFVAPS